MNKKNNVWAYFYMPILFLIIGYGTLYIVLAPILSFVSSSIDLILLNEAPTFDKSPDNFFANKEVPTPVTNDENKKSQSIPSSQIKYPTIGTEYGELIIDKVKVKSKLTFGDRPEDLRVGLGHYNGSVFPGEIGTTLIGGHNTTDLGPMNYAEVEDLITINTHYGNYSYKITAKEVLRFDDPKAIESLYSNHQDYKLILYTCYPVDMIGLTDDRLFVYADLVDGPLIDPNN